MAFQITAIAIMLAFYICYIVKMIGQKKKGITTNQLGKGKVGFVKFVEVTTNISAILVIIVGVISIILDWNYCPFGVRIVGVGVSAVGTVIFIISVLTMGDSWRAGVPKTDKTQLVTDGIYSISRNPAFWVLTFCI